jgi:hypothetical protein
MTLNMILQRSPCTKVTYKLVPCKVSVIEYRKQVDFFKLAKLIVFSILSCSLFLNIVYTLNMDRVLQTALEHLKGLGLETRLKNKRLTLKSRNGETRYDLEVQPRLSLAMLSATLSHLKKHTQPLLVTTHLSPDVIEELVKRGIDFIDTSGNCYLNSEVGYILVRGQKRPAVKETTPFSQAGLKIVYSLLTQPELQTYRDIATASDVSLGKVSTALKTLLEQGYLFKTATGKLQITDREQLLKRWELGYIEVLRPKLNPCGFKMSQSLDSFVKTLEIGLIGGEWRAAKLTKFLRPESVTLYLPSSARQKLQREAKLVPTLERPQVYLLNEFQPSKTRLAHPLLVRAELLALGDERLREVADKLLKDGHVR